MPWTVLSRSRSVALRAPVALGAKRSLIAHEPAGGTLAPVQVSPVLRKSSGWSPPTSAAVTRSTSPPVFSTASVCGAPTVSTSRSGNARLSGSVAGHGVVLSSTEAVFDAAVAEFAVTRSGRPSALKSPTATAPAPGPDRPRAVDDRAQAPVVVAEEDVRGAVDLLTADGIEALDRADQVGLGVGVEAAEREPEGAEVGRAGDQDLLLQVEAAPAGADEHGGAVGALDARREQVEVPVAVDVARHDAARPAVGELDDRAEAPVAQPEADEHPVGDDVELAVLVEVLEHEVDGRRGRERRPLRRGEAVAGR